MAKAKGTTMVGLVKYLRRQRAEAERVLPPELQPYLHERITEAAWYPEEHLAGLLRAVHAIRGGDADALYRELGALIVREHLEGVYAHLARGRSVLTLTRRASVLWQSQHDTGRLEVIPGGPGTLRFEVRDFAAPSAELCEVVGGYILESLRLSGLAGAGMEKHTCLARGDASCVWTFRWEPGGDAGAD